MAGPARDLDWLRRQLIIALAVDEELSDVLVFKGGNALAIAHGIGMRASLDLDYSLAHETHSGAALGRRIPAALLEHLSSLGLTVFDWTFGPRPKETRRDRAFPWGGYRGAFKVIETTRWVALAGRIEPARKQAWGITSDGGAQRSFTIELSTNEYCDDAGEVDVGGVLIRVYTPSMIAAEKLRSLCQQMPEYEHTTKRMPRGRDFYDIHAAVTEAGVNLTSSAGHDLIRAVFAAKDVPLRLLANLERDVDFHEAEWDDVRNSIPADRPADYGYYAEFVLRIVKRLEPLWDVDLP